MEEALLLFSSLCERPGTALFSKRAGYKVRLTMTDNLLLDIYDLTMALNATKPEIHPLRKKQSQSSGNNSLQIAEGVITSEEADKLLEIKPSTLTQEEIIERNKAFEGKMNTMTDRIKNG